MKKLDFKAALFDLDGVVFDTEPQYTVFWGGQCRLYFPDDEGLEHRIKGQTLTQIYDTLFPDKPEEQAKVTERLNAFEHDMRYEYVPGFVDFISELRSSGVKTAIVTSSNDANNYIGGLPNPADDNGAICLHTRVYKNQKLTFVVKEGKTVATVVLTATSSDYAKKELTWTGATAKVSGSDITVTPTATTFSATVGAATRFTKLTVNVE